MIFLVVFLGATLMPLSLEVLWRTDTGGTAHVQPEVNVIERTGTAFVHGKDPYSFINPHKHIKAPPGQPAYDVYNPYLPLMSLFGGARSTERATSADRRPGGLLGVHHSRRGDRPGPVSGPDGPTGAGLAEHDGAAHRGPAPRHRG